MNSILLKVLWAGMFIVCSVLGFLPEPEGVTKVLLVILSVAFFIPPGLLLWQAWRTGDRKEMKLLKLLSICSLGITLVLMVGNLLSVLASALVGDILYGALVILGTPLICGQYWALGPGLWAALLFSTIEVEKHIASKE